ncbi:MAG: lipopolysaccharide kinase InaA family protein [Planctomycetota bacterium]|jgi:tRNA A-37 threonylcarbamoyl transferase component Bud32
MSIETQNLDRQRCNVVFNDEKAAALLGGYLPELHAPANAGWELIKQNASRSVYRNEIRGKEVYVKHYHSRTLIHRLGRLLGLSDAKCEMRYARYLSINGIATIPVLAATCGNGTEWLATLAVGPTESSHEWHTQQLTGGATGKRNIQEALLRLAETIGQMHAAGVIHRDLHAGNVLIRTDTPQPTPVLMDLHRMKRRRRLSRRARVANLAQLFHDRLDWTTRTERLRFLKHYLQVSGADGTLRGWGLMVEQFARRHRRRLYAQRDRRIINDNKYFERIKLPGAWRGHVVLASKRNLTDSAAACVTFKADDWRSVLGRPQKLLMGNGIETVKDTPSVKVIRRTLEVAGNKLDVYVKRPRRRRAWKILLDCFRSARPIRAFRLGHALLTRRIATALPLVALERRIGPLLLDSILITETVDAPKLNEFLNKRLGDAGEEVESLDPPQRRQLAREVLWQMGRLLQRLHDNNFHHRDLKGPNMLVQWSEDRSPQIVLVDLDGLQRVRRLTTRRQFQGLMRLNVSLLRCTVVNHAGRLRMLLGYLRRPGSGRIHFKPYWRVLETWSTRKLREQIRSRRKQQKAQRG